MARWRVLRAVRSGVRVGVGEERDLEAGSIWMGRRVNVSSIFGGDGGLIGRSGWVERSWVWRRDATLWANGSCKRYRKVTGSIRWSSVCKIGQKLGMVRESFVMSSEEKARYEKKRFWSGQMFRIIVALMTPRRQDAKTH